MPDPPPGWEFLGTPEGLATLARVAAAIADGGSPASEGAKLRRDGVPPDRVAALLTQVDLRRRATTKFGELAAHLLLTPAGLEQASRAPVARTHARRFVSAGCQHVADLGSGIGAESLAILAAGLDVTAVEIDPFTAAFARHNLEVVARLHPGSTLDVRVADAESTSLAGFDGAFFDPARRTAGHRDTKRVTRPDGYTPSLDFAFAVASTLPTGIKLGPGFPRELIPAGTETQWVSVDGSAVETGLWFGAASRPGIRRSALVIRGADSFELTADANSEVPSEDVPVADVGAVLYEPDPAVIRARLIAPLAEHLDAGLLSPGIAYLTADTHTQTPFATSFRIVEEFPFREKDLRRALTARDIGTLEIKKRGADIDPAALRTRLRLRGSQSATLFLTRARGRHVAYLAQRLAEEKVTLPESG